MAISRYQSLPVGTLKTAQNPTISIPIVSMATALSAGVGPNISLAKQSAKHSIRIKKQRDKKGDCHFNREGSGYMIITDNTAITPVKNKHQIAFLVVILFKNPFQHFLEFSRDQLRGIFSVSGSYVNPMNIQNAFVRFYIYAKSARGQRYRVGQKRQ